MQLDQRRKTDHGRSIFRLGVGAAALGAWIIAGPYQLQAQSRSDQLLGSWDVTITSTPNPPFKIPFRILRTITTSGVIDSYAFPSITPTTGTLANSGGHGDWQKLGGTNLYSATVKYFQLNLSAPLDKLDTVGKVRENIRLSADGNSYTSVFITEIALPDGTVVGTNQGATTAKRVIVELLSGTPPETPAITSAVAGPKGSTVVTRQTQLDGSKSSSADGKALTYAWSIPPGNPSAGMSQGNTATPVVQFGTVRGTYTFQLTVTDSKGVSASDTVTVNYAGY